MNLHKLWNWMFKRIPKESERSVRHVGTFKMESWRSKSFSVLPEKLDYLYVEQPEEKGMNPFNKKVADGHAEKLAEYCESLRMAIAMTGGEIHLTQTYNAAHNEDNRHYNLYIDPWDKKNHVVYDIDLYFDKDECIYAFSVSTRPFMFAFRNHVPKVIKKTPITDFHLAYNYLIDKI